MGAQDFISILPVNFPRIGVFHYQILQFWMQIFRQENTNGITQLQAVAYYILTALSAVGFSELNLWPLRPPYVVPHQKT